MAAAGGSNIGLRKDNEDSYYINEACGLFAIADGMGGHEHGQLASRIAVEQFSTLVKAGCLENISLEIMRQLFQQANAAVHTKQQTLQSGIMGTTLTAVMVDADVMYVGHVGDSRLYWFHGGTLRQLTMDHSYYAELIRQGENIHVESKQKNVLLKALGPEAVVEGQFFQQVLAAGDLLLLCTDGLYNAVSLEEMQRAVACCTDLATTVQDLLSLGLVRGATDNLTVVLYRHESTQNILWEEGRLHG